MLNNIRIYLFIEDSILRGLVADILTNESMEFSEIDSENVFKIAQLPEADILIIDSQAVFKSHDQIIFLLKNSAAKRILIVNKELKNNKKIRFDRTVSIDDVSRQLVYSITFMSEVAQVVKSNIDRENLLKIHSQLFHEINNRLSSIFINSKLLSQKSELKDELSTEYLQQILNAAKEIQENVNNFSNFLNCEKLSTAREDLNQLISETLREKQDLISSKFIEVNTKYDVNIDFLELNRTIVSKLLLNSIEFVSLMSKESPKLTIETNNETNEIKLNVTSPNCTNDKSLFEQIFNPLFPRKLMDEKVLNELNKNIKQLMNLNVENHFSDENNSVVFIFKK
jgi:signal transduction histidine kinase